VVTRIVRRTTGKYGLRSLEETLRGLTKGWTRPREPSINSVNFARTHELLVAVRGGAHNVAGNAVCDGRLMVDLSGMKSVRVDPVQQIARAEPGTTWGEFDRETQAFGLATTGLRPRMAVSWSLRTRKRFI
jgi:FAD/FMN-containing dehydrogenase